MTLLRASALLALLMARAGIAQAQPSLPSTVTLSPILDASEKRDTISQIKDDLSRSSPCAKLLGYQTLPRRTLGGVRDGSETYPLLLFARRHQVRDA